MYIYVYINIYIYIQLQSFYTNDLSGHTEVGDEFKYTIK